MTQQLLLDQLRKALKANDAQMVVKYLADLVRANRPVHWNTESEMANEYGLDVSFLHRTLSEYSAGDRSNGGNLHIFLLMCSMAGITIHVEQEKIPAVHIIEICWTNRVGTAKLLRHSRLHLSANNGVSTLCGLEIPATVNPTNGCAIKCTKCYTHKTLDSR